MAKQNKTALKQEIATYANDITYPQFFGALLKVLANQDETLLTRGGGRGLKIYDDIERDAHAYAVLNKRKSAVISREWNVDPASDSARDRAIADEIKQWLSDLKFDRLCKDLLDATLKGYAVAEIMWARRGNRIVPTHYFARDQRRFVFDSDRRLRLLTPRDQFNGELMPPGKFVVHTVGGKDGTPYGLGLGSKLFWPVFFKRQDITFWLVFADKFGTPTARGTYPAGTGTTEQKNLLASLQAIRQDSSIIMPEGMQVDLLEAKRTGAGDFYERLARYMDEQMSEAVLGETLTTTVGSRGGNRALGEVHNEVRLEVAKEDADMLSDTLNETLIKWCVERNWPGAQPPTVWREFSEPEDLKVRAERDEILDRMGWELEEERFIEIYGDGYRRKAAALPASGMPAAPNDDNEPGDPDLPAFAEQRGLFRRFLHWLGFAESDAVQAGRARNRANQQELAEAADVSAQNWETLMQQRVDDLYAMLDDTGDLALFRERLDELLTAEPPPAVVDSVARAQFAAHVLGRGKQAAS